MTNKKNKLSKVISEIKNKTKAPPPTIVKVIERAPKQKQKHGPVTVERTVAENLGDAAGGLVKGGVGHLSRWLGFGAYTINKNSIIGAGGTIPSMHSTNDSVIVRHREYIGNIQSSTTFASNIVSMNPGLTPSFPWLSKMAQNYQEYRILGMVIEYLPLISEVATNELSLGTVVLAAQYRTDLPAYPSIAIAMESEFAVSTKPNASACLAIECDPTLSPYKNWYIRTGTPAGDTKTFDFVSVSVLCEGFQTASQVAGQLWVSYEIELMHPTAYLDPISNLFSMHMHFITSVTSSNPAGTVTVVDQYYNPQGENIIGGTQTAKWTIDGCNVTNPAAGQIAFAMPRGVTGKFHVLIIWAGDAGNAMLFDSTFGVANASISQDFPSSNAAVGATTSSTTTTHCLFSAWFTISDAQASAGQASIYCGASNTVAGAGTPYLHLYVEQIATPP